MWDDDRGDSLGRDQAGGDAGQHCMVKSRYVPTSSPHARKRLQDQVYYLHVRDRQDAEDNDRDLFTAQDTGIERPAARDLLWDARSLKSVCFHRVILSPSRGLGIKTVAQAQDWARGVMAELGRHLDRDLTYVAAVHGNTGRTHVHVLIAGEATRVSTGEGRRVVRIGKGDMDALRRFAVRVAAPLRDAARARELEGARARQAARVADLDRRLGVTVTGTSTSTSTVNAREPQASAQTTPAPQATPARRWWQRGR